MFTLGDAADFTATVTFFLACTLTALVAENQRYFLKADKPMILTEAWYCTADFLWDSSNGITSILAQNGVF